MKPTYEELELQLEESRREFRSADASIHNLELKLTDMAVQLANAESKCRELAAENAVLKKAAEFATADDMWIDQSDGMLDYRYVDWYVDVLKAAMETPATDAFLTEVRAHVAEEALKIMGNFTSDECGDSVYIAVKDFAAQIRKGAAHHCSHCGGIDTCSEHGCTATDQMIERYRASKGAAL
ncbi:hypothetical protein NLN92_00705 [Citrobacter portucalensis]|uniref:hypothetical protein n=1 Tax=Citrobacter portucalensis TaxID=1639133 RepID=UPI00226B0F47|nr:hypothetical protein [Citrobacter portucalensis]MCX8976533.1 hypothetical protein [Citrobacter portucalensis]